MARTWQTLVLACAAGAAPAAAAPPAVPTVVRVAPDPGGWEAKFAGKEGWIGGDGVYSAVLGPRRVLWLFGDTLLGTARDGRRTGAVMVNNTVGLQAGPDAPVRFFHGKAKGGKPAAVFVPDEGKGWFWPLAAAQSGGRLFVFLARVEQAGALGPFGFRLTGLSLAAVENPDDEPGAWRVGQRKVPFAAFAPGRERSWGSAVLADGGHLYVYGYLESGEGIARKRQLTVARAPAARPDDFAAWRFRTAGGWGERPDDAAPLADRMGTEFSVARAPGGKGYVLVYTENGLGDRILARFADAPDGPWSAPLLLYTCPEMRKDKGVFCYAAKAHAWAAADGELLVSYCVNTWEFARLFRDDAVYRPKFVRVKLGPPR